MNIRPSDRWRLVGAALGLIASLVFNIWANLLSSAVQNFKVTLTGLTLTTIVLLVVALFLVLTTKPAREHIAGWFVRDDLRRLTERTDRDGKLLRLFGNVDKEVAKLARAQRGARALQRQALLSSLAETAGSVMPREPGDDRRCIIFVAASVPPGHPAELHAIAWNDETEGQFARSIKLDMNRSVAGKVFRSGRPHYSRNVEQDPDYIANTSSPYFGLYKTLLAVPAIDPSKPGVALGVVCMDNTRVDAYSDDDRARMAWIAAKVGLVLYLGASSRS